MSGYLPGLLEVLAAGVFLFVAFRAHERFWTLGFLGWRKVYAGLVLYLFSGLVNLWFQWSGAVATTSGVSRLAVVHLTTMLAAVGIGLLLAGSIERLRDLAVERRRLESVRAGFDLFDTLREVAGGPYAYLEILEFSLKEMVRAADVACGGLWLFNPKSQDWVLTGAANMAQAFRQQVESVRGSGTGFDRLARMHKAHLFVRPEEIRLFFPEWEAEGYQAVLGLPLVTASAGQKERLLLGVIVLADPDARSFDEDRVRRLHAAADYVAAVVAEARLHRELDGAVRRAAEELAAAGERTAEVRAKLESLRAQHEQERGVWETKQRALESDHAERVASVRTEAQRERERLVSEYDGKLKIQAAELHDLNQRLVEVRCTMESQAASFEDERRDWSKRTRQWEDSAVRARNEFRERETGLTERCRHLEGEIAKFRTELSDQHRIYEERVKALMARLEDERRAAAAQDERHRERLQSVKDEFAAHQDIWQAERDEERRLAADREGRYEELLAAERQSRQEAVDEGDEAKRDLLSRVEGLDQQLQDARAAHTAAIERMREEWSEERSRTRERLRGLTDRLHAAQKSVRDAAASLRDTDPAEAAVARLLPRLPGGTQVFVWERTLEGCPRLLLACDRNGQLSITDREAVAPWVFEADTIPAEGPRSLPDALHWAAMESEHAAHHCAAWDGIWGTGRRPHWVVCWPWSAGGGPGENGWVTAFGFSESLPPPARIQGLTMFAEMIGALAIRARHAPLIETATPGIEEGERFEEVPSQPVPVDIPIIGLHDALIAWVADQERDAWRLELSASTVPPVAADWLIKVLNRGHESCRTNGGEHGDEFLIATETTNGRTTLRLVNTHALGGGQPDIPEHRDDGSLSGDAIEAAVMPSVAGRWLVSGDRYLGLEMVFENPLAPSDQVRTSWEDEPSPGENDQLRVLIADDDEAMRELLVGMLETLGHEATGARNSHEACEHFEIRPFDAVISNADMPQRSGVSLAEWVKSSAPHVPVILVTEQGCDDPSFNGIADCILRKPFRLDQLQECLETIAPATVTAQRSAATPEADE